MVTFRNNNTKRNNFRRNCRNERGFKPNNDRGKFGSNFSNNENFQRKNPGRNNHNAPKLIEKYNNLAREALSSGDKILSENYFQHADHFTRIQVENDNYKKNKFSNNDDKNEISSNDSLNASSDKDKKENFTDEENTKVEKVSTDIN